MQLGDVATKLNCATHGCHAMSRAAHSHFLSHRRPRCVGSNQFAKEMTVLIDFTGHDGSAGTNFKSTVVYITYHRNVVRGSHVQIEQDGQVTVVAESDAAMQEALRIIAQTVAEVEVGTVYRWPT